MTITQRQSPFAFAGASPYTGKMKDLGVYLMLLSEEPTASDWERCLGHFLRSIYGISGSLQSLLIYSGRLHAFFCGSARGGPAKHPEDYTREDVEDFIRQPSRSSRSRGQAPAVATINQRLMALASFYRYAAGYEIALPGQGRRSLLGVPAPTLGLRYGRPRRSHRLLTYAEMERLFAVIPTDTVKGLRDRTIFLMYFWTARRRSEIARLTWGDIEYGTLLDEEGHIHNGWLYHFRGKGKGEEDDIAELPEEAKLMLDRYLEAAGRLATIGPQDPLFLQIPPQRINGQPVSSHTITFALKQYASAAGLDAKRLSLHAFRHTATYHRYKAGQGLRSLQRLLRHRHIGTTNDYLEDLMGTADPTARLLQEQFGKFSQA